MDRKIPELRESDHPEDQAESADNQSAHQQCASVDALKFDRRQVRQDKIRLRWYKLSSEVGNREWVNALAARNPPPLAFMGGGCIAG